MKVAVVILALVLATVVTISHQQDGSTILDDRLKRVLRAADEHCEASSTGEYSLYAVAHPRNLNSHQ